MQPRNFSLSVSFAEVLCLCSCGQCREEIHYNIVPSHPLRKLYWHTKEFIFLNEETMLSNFTCRKETYYKVHQRLKREETGGPVEF